MFDKGPPMIITVKFGLGSAAMHAWSLQNGRQLPENLRVLANVATQLHFNDAMNEAHHSGHREKQIRRCREN